MYLRAVSLSTEPKFARTRIGSASDANFMPIRRGPLSSRPGRAAIACVVVRLLRLGTNFELAEVRWYARAVFAPVRMVTLVLPMSIQKCLLDNSSRMIKAMSNTKSSSSNDNKTSALKNGRRERVLRHSSALCAQCSPCALRYMAKCFTKNALHVKLMKKDGTSYFDKQHLVYS
ncbi:hypothetical protein EVAR_89192_1 [Eumeta japonica]|uniref:Uncharacterized protein n=1 Tax=Eumeta variegata TaxID=151549 RepID=A0A4C1YFF0_EUMVA|nr:hypothetical protein EVAR_89192_1 [Eumeta japonica]